MGLVNMFSLKGKNALVTGASYGVGLETAKTLSNAGATIIFSDVIEKNIEKGLAAYKGNSINTYGYLFDITDEQSVKEDIKKIENDVDIIDILVSSAKATQRGPMLEATATDCRKIIDIDLTGQFIMAKAALPPMIRRGYGKIINICFMMNELGRETVIGYASAEGGLKMLTENICSKFGKKNVQCNGIDPSYIATPQIAPLREIQPDGSHHPLDQFVISRTPAGRQDKSDDLASAAILLALDASDFINGHILYVDGSVLAYIGKQHQLYSVIIVCTTLNIFGEMVMFVFNEDTAIGGLGSGVKRKVLAHGGNMMAAEVHSSKRAIDSLYRHQHEQLTYISSGIFEFTVGDEMRTAGTSDTLYKQLNIVHGCRCLEKGILLDIFTPQRQDFLK